MKSYSNIMLLSFSYTNHIKDTINPYYSLLENANFSIKKKQWLNDIILLNSQFTIVFNGIICFSVQFCDNSLLMNYCYSCKCVFRSFLSQAKKYKGYPVTRRHKCCFNHSFFIYKTVSQFFEILIFSQIFRETFIMSLKSTSFSKEL